MTFNPQETCVLQNNHKSQIHKVTECGVILFSKDMVHTLLVFQNRSGKWGFPKGYMTHHEKGTKNFFKCAKRELYEETGVDLRTIPHTKYGTIILGNKLLYIIEAKVSNLKTYPMDKKEISCVQWIRREHLQEFVESNMCNATLNMLFTPKKYHHSRF